MTVQMPTTGALTSRPGVIFKIAVLSLSFIFAPFCIKQAFCAPSGNTRVMVLCYHDIPKQVNLDNYGVDQESFTHHIEYLRNHGYKFISLDDIIKANKMNTPLPEKSVLLTFDDAYLSFYDFVYPLLKLYGYPCLLAVETEWIDRPDPTIKIPLMSWEQIKEVAKSGLIEIADHGHKIHSGVIYNPQGNTSWSAVSRIYDPNKKLYESKEHYRQRIRNDFEVSRQKLFATTGVYPRAFVWPYGQYNGICLEEAKRAAFQVTFALNDKIADISNIDVLPRCLVVKNPSVEEFILRLKENFSDNIKYRVLHADLDLIYDPDPVQQEKNLDAFVERIYNMKVNVVYLQAFCDDKGDGNIRSVYFPNRILPMKADLFNRVVNQLAIREIQVYAWMPMLSIVLPDAKETEALRVREFKGVEIELSGASYERLSPFSPEAVRKINMLYEDMAINSRIDGVVYLDDGYLNDYEDFSPPALKEYLKITSGKLIPFEQLSDEQKEVWTKIKTEKLIELTEGLKKTVLYYRPQALFARTLYAEVLEDPESEEWYAQNFADSLKYYDYVVVMAYPKMEKAGNPKRWLKELVKKAKKYTNGLDKTVFKVQTYDWDSKHWIDTKTVKEWLRLLVSYGAQHIGYYSDNYIENEPKENIIRLIMSTEDFPFQRKLTVKDITPVE